MVLYVYNTPLVLWITVWCILPSHSVHSLSCHYSTILQHPVPHYCPSPWTVLASSPSPTAAEDLSLTSLLVTRHPKANIATEMPIKFSGIHVYHHHSECMLVWVQSLRTAETENKHKRTTHHTCGMCVVATYVLFCLQDRQTHQLSSSHSIQADLLGDVIWAHNDKKQQRQLIRLPESHMFFSVA